MKKIVFITSNPHKFEVAQRSLAQIGYEVVKEELEVPEIQSLEVREIASFSAKWASDKLNKPVALMDAGYYIETLNGFPGPFIKYINRWLSSNDLLKLMEGKANRKVNMQFCLGYCEPGQEPITFLSEASGQISQRAFKSDKPRVTPMDEILIPDGFDKTDSEVPREEMIKFWSKVESYWTQLSDYLASSGNS